MEMLGRRLPYGIDSRAAGGIAADSKRPSDVCRKIRSTKSASEKVATELHGASKSALVPSFNVHHAAAVIRPRPSSEWLVSAIRVLDWPSCSATPPRVGLQTGQRTHSSEIPVTSGPVTLRVVDLCSP